MMSGIVAPVVAALAWLVLAGSGFPAAAAERVALVIGNSAYRHTTPLPNPRNDAEDMAAALRRLGFEVQIGTDLDKRGMDDAFRQFARAAREADTALFFYAGHGAQYAGANYLMPVDARLVDDADLPYEMSKVDDVMADMQRARSVRIAILDACRDNPLAEQLKRSLPLSRSAALTRGLSRLPATRGTVVAYATQSGTTAADGSGRNSPFTRALLRHIEAPGLEIGPLLRRVAVDVHTETKGAQTPETSVSLLGEFYLTPAAGRPAGPQVAVGIPPAGTPPAAAPPPAAPPPAASVPPAPTLPTPSPSTTPAADSDIDRLAAQLRGAVVTVRAVRPRPKADAGGGDAKAASPETPAGSPLGEFFKKYDQQRKAGAGTSDGSRRELRPAGRLEALADGREQLTGTGFVIAADGFIATSHGLVAEADSVTVGLPDGTQLRAVIIGGDPATDLAVLKVSRGQALPSLAFADGDDLRPGARVLTLGIAGASGMTASTGTVAAVGRDLNTGPYDRFIQTGAGAAAGHAGAPLVNMDGRVVGIILVLGPEQGRADDYAWAVPVSLARPVLQSLRDVGSVRRAWFGVRIQQVTDEIAESLQIKPPRGALVAGVAENGPAKAAGIEPGDVIVRFDGRDIGVMRDLPRLVAETAVGKQVEVVVVRKGKEEVKRVTLGRLPEPERVQPAAVTVQDPPAPPTSVRKTLGLDLADLSDDLRRRHNVRAGIKGVLITAVDPGSNAASKGLTIGTVIVEVAQQAVTAPAEVQPIIDRLKGQGRNSALLLVSTPAGDLRFVALNLQ